MENVTIWFWAVPALLILMMFVNQTMRASGVSKHLRFWVRMGFLTAILVVAAIVVIEQWQMFRNWLG